MSKKEPITLEEIEKLQEALSVGNNFPGFEGEVFQIEELPEFLELLFPGSSIPVKVRLFSNEDDD